MVLQIKIQSIPYISNFFYWPSRLIFDFYQYIELQLTPFCRLTLQPFLNRFQGCVALLWHFTKWKNRKCKNPKCKNFFASDCLIQKKVLHFWFSHFRFLHFEKVRVKQHSLGSSFEFFPQIKSSTLSWNFRYLHGFILF